ncbi:hypothetical protein [Longimicrobium terrae]|uniref:hypothetical protein n=1 Tax=Longimicrobium terrae TaxID=1639882 RepID=UPI00181B0509|nr:hypothetical protein [Longimicrobium terrae]MBB4635588.1 hypothetical protein [Longimicrobium terrae]
MSSLLMVAALAACGSGDADREAPEAPSTGAEQGGAAVAVPAAPATPAVADTGWSLRMDGAGPLRIGMTKDEARAALGGDLTTGLAGPPDPTACDYPKSAALPAGLKVMMEGGRLVRVDIDSAALATAEGARVGDPESRIQQLYAGRVTEGPHKYVQTGKYLTVRPANADTTRALVFETDGGKVTRMRAGQRPQVEYVEGCS